MRCTKCDYPLWNLSTPRCPECGQPFSLRDFRFEPGSVAFACVHCGRWHEGHGPQYLPSPPGGRCIQCGGVADRHGMRVVLLRGDPATVEAMPVWRVPWEHRAQWGVWRAWWRTCVLSVRKPRELGRRLGTYAPLDAPSFAVFTHLVWLVGAVVLGSAINGAVRLLGGDGVTGIIVNVPCDVIAAVILACVWPLICTAVWGTAAHVVLTAIGSRRERLDSTLACFFYAQGPLALGVVVVVPFAGPVLVVLLYIAVCVIATVMLAQAHRVGVRDAAAAVAAGPVMAGIVVALATVMT
jgi:hypothetical protein